jgi:hypothetical protein
MAMYCANVPIRRSRGPSVDLVADLETVNGRAGPGHHAGDVVAQHERGPVLQDPLEVAVADLRVQGIDAGGAHPDQHVTVAGRGLGYVGGVEPSLPSLPYRSTTNAFIDWRVSTSRYCSVDGRWL